MENHKGRLQYITISQALNMLYTTTQFNAMIVLFRKAGKSLIDTLKELQRSTTQVGEFVANLRLNAMTRHAFLKNHFWKPCIIVFLILPQVELVYRINFPNIYICGLQCLNISSRINTQGTVADLWYSFIYVFQAYQKLLQSLLSVPYLHIYKIL